MRAIITGQVGIDKKSYLAAVARLGAERGETIPLFNVGDLMYAEAPDVAPGRILDLPLARLQTLRRAVFKDIISFATDQKNILVNTHATFRWRHGLFAAVDLDQLQLLKPDLIICLLDNVEVIHHRLHRDHTLDATLKDLMVWREEEIVVTEMLAQALGLKNRFYILSRGRNVDTTESCWRLVTRPAMKKVYPSFPMTHVANLPDVQAEIDAFRAQLSRHFITFDPGDVDEKILLDQAIAAAREGRDFVPAQIKSDRASPQHTTSSQPDERFPENVRENFRGETIRVPVRQILDIAGDIDGQIYARDFKLIDQSDMIVSLVPEIPQGPGRDPLPGLSSGVERELHHAFEAGKEVFVVWKPRKNPSPFITETATKVFPTVDDALKYFEEKGMFQPSTLFGH